MVPELRPAPAILTADDCVGLPLTGEGKQPNGKMRYSFSDLFMRLPAFLDSDCGNPVFYPHGHPIPGEACNRKTGEKDDVEVYETCAYRELGSDTGKTSIRTPQRFQDTVEDETSIKRGMLPTNNGSTETDATVYVGASDSSSVQQPRLIRCAAAVVALGGALGLIIRKWLVR